jgi:hypothetical protein
MVAGVAAVAFALNGIGYLIGAATSPLLSERADRAAMLFTASKKEFSIAAFVVFTSGLPAEVALPAVVYAGRADDHLAPGRKQTRPTRVRAERQPAPLRLWQTGYPSCGWLPWCGGEANDRAAVAHVPQLVDPRTAGFRGVTWGNVLAAGRGACAHGVGGTGRWRCQVLVLRVAASRAVSAARRR